MGDRFLLATVSNVSFTAEELQLIDSTAEPIIETRSGDRVYRTVIWAVVDNAAVYVRSFLGAEGRWYQRAIATSEVVLECGDSRIEARAVSATDDDSVAAASDGFRRKYRKGRSRDAMVRPEVLNTTMRLDPVR